MPKRPELGPLGKCVIRVLGDALDQPGGLSGDNPDAPENFDVTCARPGKPAAELTDEAIAQCVTEGGLEPE